MRFTGLFVCIVIFFAACRGKNHIPSSVIPPEKMQAVLWDMLRADQFLADYVFSRDSGANKAKESVHLYAEIYALHKITPEKFKVSFDYYQRHPAMLRTIMDSMNKQSLFKEDTLPKIDTTIPVPEDSLKRLKKTGKDSSRFKRLQVQ